MSDASPDHKLGRLRQLRSDELAIIKKLVAGTPFEKIVPELDSVLVRDAQDGGMGGVWFHKDSSERRRFGKEIAEGFFRDADGVPVSVGLYLDQFGDLFELDVWKVDFSPLIRYAHADDFEVIKSD
jgi:hypothetical protein